MSFYFFLLFGLQTFFLFFVIFFFFLFLLILRLAKLWCTFLFIEQQNNNNKTATKYNQYWKYKYCLGRQEKVFKARKYCCWNKDLQNSNNNTRRREKEWGLNVRLWERERRKGTSRPHNCYLQCYYHFLNSIIMRKLTVCL